jgi:hypothetical protein
MLTVAIPQVSSDVTFPDLDMETLQTDATFKLKFEEEFTTIMAAAADVARSQVEIRGYSSGSVVVNSVVLFNPDDTSEVLKAEALVARMVTAPATIFQESALLSSYGEVIVTLPPPPPPPPPQTSQTPPPSPQEKRDSSTTMSPPDMMSLEALADSSSAVHMSKMAMVVALAMLALAM